MPWSTLAWRDCLLCTAHDGDLCLFSSFLYKTTMFKTTYVKSSTMYTTALTTGRGYSRKTCTSFIVSIERAAVNGFALRPCHDLTNLNSPCGLKGGTYNSYACKRIGDLCPLGSTLLRTLHRTTRCTSSTSQVRPLTYHGSTRFASDLILDLLASDANVSSSSVNVILTHNLPMTYLYRLHYGYVKIASVRLATMNICMGNLRHCSLFPYSSIISYRTMFSSSSSITSLHNRGITSTVQSVNPVWSRSNSLVNPCAQGSGDLLANGIMG